MNTKNLLQKLLIRSYQGREVEIGIPKAKSVERALNYRSKMDTQWIITTIDKAPNF